MYSKVERKKAVDLYIQYDKQLSKTIKTLRYPTSRYALRKWHYEFSDGCEFKDIVTGKPKYTEEQKEKAIMYYFDHGTNVANTIVALGYPSYALLKAWINDKFLRSTKRLFILKVLVRIFL